ncbi:inorganic pyrophosphatase-like [Teleopsis dalmanni]|uniref:inorganic pyrophosphatase-like n=1 Tax=Teleopsis dalmanni TaxID=139649 RepID=UPI0018CE939F|nr:inorganic pyrophosphatase-like [Teleopsis dalmanni]XP_037949180.1 inorganic pyrophosphatase-like [Teleopsis dalmanni]
MTAIGGLTKFFRFSRSAHVLLRRSNTLNSNTKSNILITVNCDKRQFTTATKQFQNKKDILLKEVNKMSSYTTVEKGAPDSTNYSIYFQNEEGHAISPLHDIPLYANEEKTIYNMVVEIPRWTNAKMEISLKNPLNPIKQDIKKGKLRYVANCFPHKGYIWNYGAFPQTWENPDHIELSTGCKGDNDPIDVLEIGYRVAQRGEVVQVKILGTVALIDEGETDWKIIAIDIRDPLAEKLNDICDIYKHCPGLLRATVEWFKIYKIPDGKPENQFAFNGDPKDAQFAIKVVSETHNFWKGLVDQSLNAGSISCATTTVKNSPYLINQEDADKILAEAPEGGDVQDVSDTVDKWHFIHLG